MFPLLRFAVALGAVRPTLVCAINGSYKLTWSTDGANGEFSESGLIGSDGPWQAIQVVGGFHVSISRY